MRMVAWPFQPVQRLLICWPLDKIIVLCGKRTEVTARSTRSSVGGRYHLPLSALLHSFPLLQKKIQKGKRRKNPF